MRGVSEVDLMGVAVNNLTGLDVVERILHDLEHGVGGWVATPNVDILRQAAADPSLAELVARADLVIPDGMPLVWASRLQGTPLQERVAGSELVFPLCEAAAERGMGIFLLGGAPGVAEQAARTFLAAAPDLRIVGTSAPPMGFEEDPEEMATLLADLDDARPDIVLCCLGFPKQERVMASLSPHFPRTWFLGAGGTLTIASGITPPAPHWMRRNGLEWLHRLGLEPRRLSRRYLVDDIPFALRLLGSCGAARLVRLPTG